MSTDGNSKDNSQIENLKKKEYHGKESNEALELRMMALMKEKTDSVTALQLQNFYDAMDSGR